MRHDATAEPGTISIITSPPTPDSAEALASTLPDGWREAISLIVSRWPRVANRRYFDHLSKQFGRVPSADAAQVLAFAMTQASMLAAAGFTVGSGDRKWESVVRHAIERALPDIVPALPAKTAR